MLKTIENFWIKTSFVNLLIVALLGVVMRLKIGYEFPYFDQKNLQYSHYQFAFGGWVTHILMVLLVRFISPNLKPARIKIYNILILLNLICAYGLLLSFAFQGYNIFSVTFSAFSIFVALAFAYCSFIDLTNPINQKSVANWFNASLLFSVISTFGTVALSYMMISKNIDQHNYLAAIYWFLHFQYNGWFFFTCGGLFIIYLKKIEPTFTVSNSVFWLFAVSCIPAYGLSVLWLKLPFWVYLIVLLGAIAQAIGWVKLLLDLHSIKLLRNKNLNLLGKILFVAIGLAFTIKLGLQLGSTIPAVSKLAFGFRPIVIAYLHLVLLAFISVFIVTNLYLNNLIHTNRTTLFGIVVFVGGVFINELVLAVQGIASFSYRVIPYVNSILFFVSIALFVGIFFLLLGQFLKNKIV